MNVKQAIEKYREGLNLEESIWAEDVVLVIENGHQTKPRAFLYFDAEEYERDYLAEVERVADKGDGVEYTRETRVERLEEFAARDLHSWVKLEGASEILAYELSGHQWSGVFSAIVDAMIQIEILVTEN